MTDKQKAAYEWAKSHPDYRSVAAGHARELAGLVDELMTEMTEIKRRVIAAAMDFPAPLKEDKTMNLERAIRLARVWAFGGVCSLQEGEAQEYHKLALEALEAQKNGAVPVVRCGECKHKEDCIRRIEFIGRNLVLEQNTYEYHPLSFCSYGERKDGAE